MSIYDQLLRRFADEIVGQPHAVRAFTRAAMRALFAAPEQRPSAVILISGPSGCGKWQLTQVLGSVLAVPPDDVLRLTPSFLPDPHHFLAYLRVMWSRVPRRLIIIEGVERSSPPVVDLLASLFSNGTDPYHLIDLRRTVFVLETNLVQREVDELGERAVGFQAASEDADDRVRSDEEQAIQATFPLRFLGAIDEVVCLRRVWSEELPFILDRLLAQFGRLLAPQGILLQVDEAAREYLLDEGRRQLRLGARGLRLAIHRNLELPVLDAIHSGALTGGGVVHARRTINGVVLQIPGHRQATGAPPSRIH